MGSVSRGRWRKGGWGGVSVTDAMSTWPWLTVVLLLVSLAASVRARPPIVPSEEEEAAVADGE